MPKIFSLNLNYYGDKHGTWAARKKLIIDALQSENPDIVALQAVCTDPATEAGKNQATQLAEEVSELPISLFTPVSRQANGRQEGNAILSKVPLQLYDHLLLSLKPGARDHAQRLVQKAIFRNGFCLFNAHFSWIREQTETNIRETLSFINSTDMPALFCGDLNTDPKNDILKPLVSSGWTDLWPFINGRAEGFTFESDNPFTRIDYAWANQALVNQIQSIYILQPDKNNVRLSDHLGLIISF